MSLVETGTRPRPPLIVRGPSLLQMFALWGHLGEESRRKVLDWFLHEDTTDTEIGGRR